MNITDRSAPFSPPHVGRPAHFARAATLRTLLRHDRTSGPARPSPRALTAVLGTIFSFEALFTVFLYSNTLKYFFPPLPVDETALLLALCGLSFSVLIWRHGLYRPALPLLWTALAFFGWLTLSMLWSPGRVLALRSVAYNLTFNVFCLCVGALLLAADRRRTARFFACVLAVATFLSIHGLWIYSEYGTFRFYRGFDGIAAYLLWGFPVAAASAVSLAFAFAAPPGRPLQLFSVALSALFAIFLFVASGRAPLLSYGVCLAIPLFLVAPRVLPGHLFVARAQLAAGMSTVVFFAYVIYAVYTNRLPATIVQFLNLWGYIESGGVSVPFQRLNYWYNAIQYWSRSPFFGTGTGSFSSFYHGGYEIPGTQPHNIILEILCELGLVGLALFIILLGVALRSAKLQRLRGDPLLLASFLLFVGLFGARAMTSTDLAFQWELFVSLGLLKLTGSSDREADR